MLEDAGLEIRRLDSTRPADAADGADGFARVVGDVRRRRQICPTCRREVLDRAAEDSRDRSCGASGAWWADYRRLRFRAVEVALSEPASCCCRLSTWPMGRRSGWCRARQAARRPTATRSTAALAWQDAGAEWVHLVDLDAAFGRGSNRDLLAEVVGRLDVAVELSGGIRDDAVAGGGARNRLRARQPRHGGAGGPAVDRTRHRRARRPHRRRARRAGHDPGGPRLDPGGRRPVGDARPARRGRLRPLRAHRRHQGRHAARPQPRPAARVLRAHGPAGRRERRRVDASTTSRRCARWSRSASRAPSSARRCTPGRSPWRRLSRWPDDPPGRARARPGSPSSATAARLPPATTSG